MPNAIHLDYEYGDLQEVIVGRGIMRYPEVDGAAWVAEGLKVLPDAEKEKARQRSGKHSRDLPKYDLLEAENADLITILEEFGVTVHRPDEITDEQVAANYGAEWLSSGGCFRIHQYASQRTPERDAPRQYYLFGSGRVFSEPSVGCIRSCIGAIMESRKLKPVKVA